MNIKKSNSLRSIWISFFVVLLISGLCKNTNIDMQSIHIILLGIHFPVVVFSLKTERSDNILINAFILRILIMFIDIYFSGFANIPHSGIDSVRFYDFGILVSENLNLLSGPIYGSYYTKFLGLLFNLFGTSRIIAQYFNVLLGVSSVILLNRVLKLLNISKKNADFSIRVFAYLPHTIIFSSILLRESAISFFAIISLYYLVRWIKSSKSSWHFYFISIGALGVSALLHSGMISLIVGHLLALVYDKKISRFRVGKENVFYVMVILLFFVAYYPQINDLLFVKFNRIDNFGDLFSQSNVRGGGSAYLTSLKTDSFPKLLLFLPVRAFYFLTSPLPQNWRGVKDIFSFFLDGVVFMYFIVLIAQNRRYVKSNDIAKILLFSILSFLIVFSVGVANAGTAMRHRHKVFFIVVVLDAILKDKKVVVKK